MWGNVVDFHNLLFVWVHCKKRKRKKKAISRLWHWRLSGKSKHKLESYWIVLSCCVQCFFFVFFKRPSVAETRPNGLSQSIKCFRGLFACLLSQTATTVVIQREEGGGIYICRKKKGIQMERDVQITVWETTDVQKITSLLNKSLQFAAWTRSDGVLL